MTQSKENREYERRESQVRSARLAAAGWAHFLCSHTWQSFVTHTFADNIHPEAAHNIYRRWIRHVELLTDGPLRWARATEYQKRGVLHYHSLIDGWLPLDRITGGEVIERREAVKALWMDLGGGFSSVDPYTPARAIYCTKYVVKGGEIDLGGAWYCTPGPRQRRLL